MIRAGVVDLAKILSADGRIKRGHSDVVSQKGGSPTGTQVISSGRAAAAPIPVRWVGRDAIGSPLWLEMADKRDIDRHMPNPTLLCTTARLKKG